MKTIQVKLAKPQNSSWESLCVADEKAAGGEVFAHILHGITEYFRLGDEEYPPASSEEWYAETGVCVCGGDYLLRVV